MKFAIFVCIFAVLACHEALGQSQLDHPALLEGDCKSVPIPPSALNSCNKIVCSKDANGVGSFVRHECPLTQCANGKELGTGPHVLTEKYPNCCRPNKCD